MRRLPHRVSWATVLAALTAMVVAAPRLTVRQEANGLLPIVLGEADFPHAGEVLTTRDLQWRARRLRRFLACPAVPVDPAVRTRCERTLRWIADVRQAHPQTIRFALRYGRPLPFAVPLDEPRTGAPCTGFGAQLCIVGGEIEAIITAMAAADRGLSVAMIYAGPLGGLVSDSGGNLRYFDGYGRISRPREQVRLFREALGMAPGNMVALPENVTPKLVRFLEKHYRQTIRVLHTRSYDSLLVRKTGGRLASVVTEEGCEIRAQVFVDMDPEARVTEKAGVPMSTDTPNLASGLVFNVDGIDLATRSRLKDLTRIPAEAILDMANVSWDDALRDPALARELKRYHRRYQRDFIRIYDFYGLGWTSLAEGFSLLMHCAGLRNPSLSLRWLNGRRSTSGFNIAFDQKRAAFNSISYHLGPNVLQHDHDILREDRWRALRDIERPALERYLRDLTDLPNLRVTLPRQFYVRRASAYFVTLHPYTLRDFATTGAGPYSMAYPNDFRDVLIRDAYDGRLMRLCWSHHGRVLRWTCRPSASLTCVPNLYSLNKSAMPPEFFGCLRVLQNLATTGVALAEDLARRHHRSGGVPSGRTTTTQRFVNTSRAVSVRSLRDTPAIRAGNASSADQPPASNSARARATARSTPR